MKSLDVKSLKIEVQFDNISAGYALKTLEIEYRTHEMQRISRNRDLEFCLTGISQYHATQYMNKES